MEKPDYIPRQIWDAAIFLLDAAAELDTKSARASGKNLKRLLFDVSHKTYASDLKLTWKRVIADLDSYDCSLDHEDRGQPYRLFLDTLASLTESIDAGMRASLDDGAKRLERIAALARELEKEWDDLADLREQKGIEWAGASEYDLLTGWADASRCQIVGEHWRDFPRLGDLLEQLGNAAEFQPLAPPLHYEYAEVGDGGASGLYDTSALVRHFDSCVATLKKYGLPEDFEVGSTDLARLLSALLQEDISKQSVNNARNKIADATKK